MSLQASKLAKLLSVNQVKTLIVVHLPILEEVFVMSTPDPVPGFQSDLSKESILESLRLCGIQDLNDFLDHGLQAFRKSQPTPSTKLFPEFADQRSEEIVIDLLFNREAQNNNNIVHKEPKLPFILGDTYYKPPEINRFNGQLLRFVWDQKAVENGFLRAINNPDEMRAFLTQSSTSQAMYESVSFHVPGTGHTFYEDINFGGSVLNLPYRHAFPNLTEVTMKGWWWWTTSWNDQISSLRTGSGPVILAADTMDPYLSGPTITFRENSSVSWIGQAWNDRVSAILG